MNTKNARLQRYQVPKAESVLSSLPNGTGSVCFTVLPVGNTQHVAMKHWDQVSLKHTLLLTSLFFVFLNRLEKDYKRISTSKESLKEEVHYFSNSLFFVISLSDELPTSCPPGYYIKQYVYRDIYELPDGIL